MVSELFFTQYTFSCRIMWTVILLLSTLYGFKIDTIIENLVGYEVRSVITYCLAKNHWLIEINRQYREVYGDGIISKGDARQWYIMFENDCTNIHDVDRSGRPAFVKNDLSVKVDVKIRENNSSFIVSLLLFFFNDEHLARKSAFWKWRRTGSRCERLVKCLDFIILHYDKCLNLKYDLIES